MSEKICSTDGCENFVTAQKRSKCRSCLTRQHLAWRAANLEKRHEYESQYRSKNAERLRLKEKEPKRKDQKNARRRERYQSKPEYRAERNEASAEYFAANREELNRQRSERAKSRTPAERWREHLKYRYAITPEDYDEMLAAQNGCCALCEKPPSEKERKLSVDHCHNSNRVRQLLCRFCNVLIGHLEGKPELVQRAYEYIARHASRTE